MNIYIYFDELEHAKVEGVAYPRVRLELESGGEVVLDVYRRDVGVDGIDKLIDALEELKVRLKTIQEVEDAVESGRLSVS